MPVLDWIGKKAVVNHHRVVPYRLIHCDKDKSAGDPDAGNLLVQGDNLEALKALLPYYAGKVKCIYIDQPYNTGNEGWVYNDNVNSPEIKAWLGSVVGKEAEDLSRHDKWLCMMYPRLRLLKEFLAEDGVLAISCDDNEVHRIRSIFDDIFGSRNFISTIIWQKRYSPAGDATWFSEEHDFILFVAREKKKWSPKGLARTEKQNSLYKNPDDDPRGPWQSDNYTANKNADERPKSYYPLIQPNTGEEIWPSRTAVWRYSPEEHKRHVEEGLIWWGIKGDNKTPRFKRFLTSVGEVRPHTIWQHTEVGHNQDAKRELIDVFGREENLFPTPKPISLIARIVQLCTKPGDIVLDSFAGSGTTGVAVAREGGGRRFIMIEMEPAICQQVTAARLQRIIEGYDREKSNGSKDRIEGTGGGFRFCTLGEPLFDSDGNVSPTVTFADLAAHVFFCETGSPIPRRADAASPLIGTFQGRAVYLLHAADAIGVASANAGNVLTASVLQTLPLPEKGFTGARVVYAEGCTVPDDRLARQGVTFKQIPYQIEGL
jgi:adenine-specific DNA-methyltransferase